MLRNMLNPAFINRCVHAIVTNGYLSQRTIQIGIGNIKIKVTKISGSYRQKNMLQQLIITALSEVCKSGEELLS